MDEYTSDESQPTDPENNPVMEQYRLETVMAGTRRKWPGVKPGARDFSRMRVVEIVRSTSRDMKWVEVKINGLRQRLICDTGSKLTIIPPTMYHSLMGKVVAARYRLRAWGSKKFLDVKGMFHTMIEAEGGAQVDTWIYIVEFEQNLVT